MKKFLQPFLTSIIVGTSILTLAACNNKSNEIKEEDNLKTTLQEYIEGSSPVIQSLVLANYHNYDVKTMLKDKLNIDNNLKPKLSGFFNGNFFKNYDYLSLFKNQQTANELFKNTNNFPLAQNRNETGLLSFVQILLSFITNSNLTGADDVFKDILNRNLEESFNFYEQTYYDKFISLFTKRIKEHNAFIREGKTYGEVLEWSSKNIRTVLLKMGTDVKEIKNLDADYKKMNQDLVNILIKNAYSKRNDKNPPEPAIVINQEILNNLKTQIKKPENIIELAISALPIFSYIVDTAEDMPLKDVKEIWYTKSKTPKEITYFAAKQLTKKYSSMGLLSIDEILNKFKNILKLDDGGLNFRKLMLAINTVPSIDKIFDGLELRLDVDIWLVGFISKTNIIEAVAYGGISVANLSDQEVFSKAFPAIKENLEPKLKEYFQEADKYINEYEPLAKGLIKRDSLFNIKEMLFFAEDVADKVNDIMITQKNAVIKAHESGSESLFKILHKILNNSENNTQSLEKIISSDRIRKINKSLSEAYAIAIRMFGIPELLKIIQANDNYYLNDFNKNYSPNKWKIINSQLKETKNNRIITYTINYKFDDKEYQYNIELQTASKKSNQLQITKFIKQN